MEYYNLPANKTFLISQKALIVEQNKILLLKQSYNQFNHNPVWELPGGFLEMDENLEDGLNREVKEETGLIIKILQPIGTHLFTIKDFIFKDGRCLDVNIAAITYLAQSISGNITLSDEHQEYRWIDKKDLPNFELETYFMSAIKEYLQI